MRIPSHLSHLRVWHGYPVPIVNCWTEEAEDWRWYMDVDRNLPPDCVSRYGIFTQGEPGVGDALLAKQCPQRQRKIMIRGLCQVCGVELKNRRYLAISTRSTVHPIEVDEISGPKPATAEPPLCKRCAAFAVKVCPGLIRRRREDDLIVGRLHDFRLVTVSGYMEGPEEQAQIAAGCILWVKLMPLDVRDERGRKIRFNYGGDADE